MRVTGLTKDYGTNRVLDDVTFEVPEGSVCTLLGSSGSGKTTTLRMLAGLERPDAGEIEIGGRTMATRGALVPAENRGVGLVFQAYALWPHMRIFDQIAYPLRVRRLKRAAIETAVTEAARMVGLEELLRRYPSELSGGQQQRVALARALVFGPRLLLLDEPLSNLDAALRRQTRLELEQLQKRVKVTTIYVTHDQEEAMAVSDRVVVMSKGRVVTIDTPRAIYDRPTTVFVASFVGASNILHGTVGNVVGDRVEVVLPDGASIRGVTPHQLRVGDPAVVAIKPIDIALRGDGPDHGNAVPAEVLSSTYIGSQIELVLRAAGRDFRVPVERWDTHAVGDRVELLVDPARVSVLHSEME